MYHLFSADVFKIVERRRSSVDQHPSEGDGGLRQANADARVGTDGRGGRDDGLQKSGIRLRLLHPHVVSSII